MVTQLVTLAAVKISKLPERKKCIKRNNLCTGDTYCVNTSKVSYHHNYLTGKKLFCLKWASSYESVRFIVFPLEILLYYTVQVQKKFKTDGET